MALVKARRPESLLYRSPITNRISQLRYCILVHSLLYYELSVSHVIDKDWDLWAQELVNLQSTYPEESKRAIFYPQFLDFDGTTGHDLPYKDYQILQICGRLLRHKKDRISLNLLSSVVPEGYEFERFKKNGYKY